MKLKGKFKKNVGKKKHHKSLLNYKRPTNNAELKHQQTEETRRLIELQHSSKAWGS